MDAKTYDGIWIENASMNDTWPLWFDPDTDPDIFPDTFIYSQDAAAQMLDEGTTYWNHPGWIQDVMGLLRDWAHSGKLIRVRLTAGWLLSTLPPNPLDAEFAAQLRHLADGEFCVVYAGMTCFRMKREEY